MQTAPVIIVQIVHIEGPLKGKITELPDSVIYIGRHPSCQIMFPAESATVSRKHAVIKREGNRFKLTDTSTNGTIVNGIKITETFLKDGDVITVSEGGPKVSFLTQVSDTPARQQQPVNTTPAVEEVPSPPIQEPPPPTERNQPHKEKASLSIQYGPTLRTFDELPVTIGKHPDNILVLDCEELLDVHAEIYFENSTYHIRDLTGQQMITINGIPVEQGSVLHSGDRLALTKTGPFFKSLGNGRLTEDARENVENGPSTARSMPQSVEPEPDDGKGRSVFKKIFSKR